MKILDATHLPNNGDYHTRIKTLLRQFGGKTGHRRRDLIFPERVEPPLNPPADGGRPASVREMIVGRLVGGFGVKFTIQTGSVGEARHQQGGHAGGVADGLLLHPDLSLVDHI